MRKQRIKKGVSKKHNIAIYFMTYMKKYIFQVCMLVFLVLLSETLMLIPPYINGKIIDFVLLKKFNSILFLVFTCFFIYLISNIFSLFQTILNIKLENKILVDFRNSIYEKIIYMKLEKYNKKNIGEYLSRLDGDADTIITFYLKSIPTLIMCFINVIVAGCFAFSLSIQLSFIGAISFPISMIIYYFYGKKIKVSYEKVRKSTDNYTSYVQDVLSAEKTIKALHIENNILADFILKLKNLAYENINNGRISAFGGLVQTLSSVIIELLLILIASYFIIKGYLSIGSYVAFNVYLSKFITSLRIIVSTNLNLQMVYVSMDRLDEIFYGEEENLSGEHTDLILNGNIDIENVNFYYEQENPILNNLTITFFPNEITAIVGTSGCGKTTLLNLIVKFYDCKKGMIKVGGEDINDIPLHKLRNTISYIEQEPYIFKGTIRDNLVIVHQSATHEEIVEACKKAYIYEMIISLKLGFETIIGEKGYNLSGGQKQRLAIARGILKKSKIFLLDEVTSELDGGAEKNIMKAISELAKENTVIMSAHRLTTVKNIPRIVVLKNGNAVAEGNHEKLINTCNEYKILFSEHEEVI